MTNENETTLTITLNSSSKRTIQQLATVKEVSFDEMLQRVVERGVYDITYRTKRNAKVYAQNKALKQLLKDRPELLENV